MIGGFYINPESGEIDGKLGAIPGDVKSNIVCRKYVNGEWSRWQYYQETFLSDDGSGTNTLVAPTLKLFLNKINRFSKVYEWSGVVNDEDFTPVMQSALNVTVDEIEYSTYKKLFYVNRPLLGKYISFSGEGFTSADYTDKTATYKGLDGCLAIYNEDEELVKMIPEAPRDGKTYGRNNGAWKQVESAGTVTIDAELNKDSSNPVRNSAITKGIEAANEFYPIPGDLTSLIEGEGEEVINKVKAVIGTINGWTLNSIKKKYLIDKNGLTASFYSSSVGSGNYQYYIS